ncbi:type VI secretion system baseplate subunit TssG [Pseudomonas yangonensis]|uniref:type VI secretion system baseplate subunit TssG n=1 Tax=Pseudomonas yangonensis TaxID=2579922 RepID=UPI00137B1A73|nr:type VI secretion system baseplate subunit TssG [Pseudomonas yangonensis]
MESPARPSSEPLDTLAQMQAQPWEYDFFQALRRIENEHPHLPRLGRSRRLADDPLRLGQRQEGTFAPATLAAVTPASDERPARLEQYFFGLGGPNGPLPLHLTEYVRERQRNHADSTSKHFLDLFHHRLLTLFYRAWAEARPTVSHDRPDDDYWSARLAAFSGRGMPSLRQRGLLDDAAKLHYSGHLAAQTRYPDGLKAILADYFGVPVQIEEYAGSWLSLPERTRLGVESSQLGVDFCLGSQVWDRQHSFRICFGPLTLEQYNAMLPDGDSFAALVAWVAEYQGDELDWQLNLVLQREEVPALRLNGQARLGYTTWLGQPQHDARDLVLARHHATATPPADQSRRTSHG